MKQKPMPHRLSVFVCGGKKCHGGKKIHSQLKKAVKNNDLSSAVRVCSTGCMDQCDKGPNVMIFPDNIWLSHVKERNIDEILEHLAAHLYVADDR